ncbi:DUF4214 domain-containing protein [Massilia sp. erpn]|uniref:DUF4214 domain-containing protein n=1 Tax=Massilia sp. erpn TaxID=2738142 RepID=UPI002103CE1E|nr:DUF4214 domain-containing protein [Massilia sp. erpn]UTY55709.1 DUF4214 domain-containing protein [Massilia sp. erpn]
MKRDRILGVFILSLLAACGGGGNGASTAQVNLPSVPEIVPPPAVIHADSDYYDQVQQIHLAYLGAAADPAALNFWATRNNAAKLAIKISDLAIAYNTDANARTYIDALANSQSSQEIYRGNNDVFLTTVYKTLFSRAPSAMEKTQWLNQLDSGKLSRQQAPVMILGNAPSGDVALLKNKLLAAREFSAAINTTELKALFTSAPDALAVSRALLSAIPALPADNPLLAPVARAAVKRFEADAQPTAFPLPGGSVRGFTGYLFRRPAAIMCATVQGKQRVDDFQPLENGLRYLKAEELASQEFNAHHTDCSDSNGTRRISFDGAGNATLTGNGATLRYTAAQVSGALNGLPIEDPVNKTKTTLLAYALPLAYGSASVVLVEKVVVAGSPGESISAWSQP